MYFKGSPIEFSIIIKISFLSLKIVLILANSADRDEMQHNCSVILHLNLVFTVCLGTCLGVSGIQRVNL